MRPSARTSLQVLDTLDMFARCLSRGDIPGALALLEKKASFVAPDRGDILRDSASIEKYLEREGERFRNLELMNLEIGAVGTIAWISGDFAAGADMEECKSRGHVSAVLKGTGHAWEIVHLHFSYQPGTRPTEKSGRN